MRAMFVVAVFEIVCAPCFAQAWIAPKGETTVSLTFHFSDFLGHLDRNGDKVYLGASRSQGLTLGVDYSATDRLAFGFSVPYTATQNGKDPSPVLHREGIDDGKYHATWQDYHFDVRYNMLMRPVVLTPFLTYVQPSHHYESIGEAGAGRDLRELRVGFNVGRLFDPVLPNGYVQARVGYIFSEKLIGIGTNRTIADLDLGYFVTPRFAPRLIASYQVSHGGLTDEVFALPPTDPLFREHDRILRDTHLRVGIGASYAITPTLDVNAAYLTIVRGKNTHYGRGVLLGVSRTFAAR